MAKAKVAKPRADRETARRRASIAAETKRSEELDIDCTDVDVMCALRDEFGISIGKVGKLVTAGDAYEVLAAKLRTRLPDDAWSRLRPILSTVTGKKIATKATKLR